MKTKMKLLCALVFALSFLGTASLSQAYYYYGGGTRVVVGPGYYGGYYGPRYYHRYYTGYYGRPCRWVSGYWAYGYWYPGHRVCW